MPARGPQADSGIPDDAVVTSPNEQADIASTAAQGEQRSEASSGVVDGGDAAGEDKDSPAKPRLPSPESAALGWQQVSSALQQLSDGLWDTDISSSDDEDDLSDGDFADGLSDGARVA